MPQGMSFQSATSSHPACSAGNVQAGVQLSFLTGHHGITSMEYGLIFHVTRIGGNFRGIWADIPRYSYREILLYE